MNPTKAFQRAFIWIFIIIIAVVLIFGAKKIHFESLVSNFRIIRFLASDDFAGFFLAQTKNVVYTFPK